MSDDSVRRTAEAPDAAPAPQPPRLVAVTTRTIWVAVAVVAGTALVALVLLKALDAVLLLFVAILLAEGIRPPVRALGRLRVPRAPAVLVVYAAGLGIAGALAWLLVQPVVGEAQSLADHAPDYLAQLQRMGIQAQQAVDANPDLQGLLGALGGQATAEAEKLLPALLFVPLSVIGVVFGLFIVLTVAFFWLTAVDGLRPFVLGVLPPERRAAGDALLARLGAKLGGYVRGTVAGMLLFGATTGVALFLLGVPYALLLGILVGLFQLIPFIGPPISGAVAALVALAAVGPLKAAEVVAAFAAIQLIEGHTLIPLVLSRTVRTNPLTVIVGVVVGAALLGLPGAVLGVPLAAVIQEVVVSVLAPLARRGPTAGSTAAPGAAGPEPAHAGSAVPAAIGAGGTHLPAAPPAGDSAGPGTHPAATSPGADTAGHGG